MKTILNKKTIIAALTGITLLAALSMTACTSSKTDLVIEGEACTTSKTGWVMDGEKWYYYDDQGIMLKNNWILISDPEDEEKWFYFDDQGVMVNNTTLNIDGKDYVFSSNGVCTSIE